VQSFFIDKNVVRQNVFFLLLFQLCPKKTSKACNKFVQVLAYKKICINTNLLQSFFIDKPTASFASTYTNW